MSRQHICLRAIGPGFQDRTWEAHQSLRIGRSSNVEVSLNDASLSRAHAEVFHRDDGWVVHDLGSTNGTFLNGIRIGQIPRHLREQDVLQFGNVVLVVAALADPAAAPAARREAFEVQGTARQTWQESLELLAADVTRRTRPGEQLVALLRAGHFCEAGSIDESLHGSLRDAVAALGARRGALLLPDELTGRLAVRVQFPVGADSAATPPCSMTLANRCRQRGESILCGDVGQDAELRAARSVNHGAMHSIICALIRTPHRALGVLHLDRGPAQPAFTLDDLHLADAVAAGLSAGVASALFVQQKQRHIFVQTVIALVQTLELRDDYTSGHNQRTTDFALLLAEELHLSAADRHLLQIAGPLHDIGKIGLPDAVLRKRGALTPAEYEAVKAHSAKGADLLGTIPDLAAVAPVVRSHHERWDGSGYPDGLARDAIPLLARVIAVADAFDVLTAESPYRGAGSVAGALAQIRDGVGTQFDPECARAFLRLQPRLEELLQPRTVRAAVTTKSVHELLATA